MATTMHTFPRMLKMLRENSGVREKRDALTYIRSNAKKLESTNTIKEEQYKELCKLVIDAFANGDQDIQHEAYETFNVVVQEFKDHNLNIFESLLQAHRKTRVKILKLLEVGDDCVISAVSKDAKTLNFFTDCMQSVQPSAMGWIAPTACVDNLDALIEAENRPLSDEDKLEEDMINYATALLRRLYIIAEMNLDQKIQQFNILLMEKVVPIAYMGHKRQRSNALKLLKQVVGTNIISHIRTQCSEVWARYKTTLQSTYCKRMLLLVSSCEPDWATQWNISIKFLGTDLHRGAGLINNLLSVEEKAFKSTDTIIRRQAFLSWKLLVDNFALDPQELATARRIKLLCIPLNAKNSKTELIALTKLEVWWHLIIKLYKDITKFVNPVMTQFLNFCFGPLGDTPLLSSKFDVVASPGKRFFKTKAVAVDALCQLLVTKQENHIYFTPILEERLPHAITNAVFQECYKSIIHSVGEALLILSQLKDREMKKRYQLSKLLWMSLCNYIRESKPELKEDLYKDVIVVMTELVNHAADKPMIKDLILDVLLFELVSDIKEANSSNEQLSDLLLKFLSIDLLRNMKETHYVAIKCLLWSCIKVNADATYRPNALRLLSTILQKMKSLQEEKESISFMPELWCVLAEVLTKYMEDSQEINEGNAAEHKFTTVQSILMFPFTDACLHDAKEVQELAEQWKMLYKQFDMQADLVATVKPNEILSDTVDAMIRCLNANKKCSSFAVHCLDVLMSSVNYKFLLAQDGVSSILQLIVQLTIHSLNSAQITESEITLKALSALLITVYGHDPERVVAYLLACKPAIDLMLITHSQALSKEISSMWDTVVSVFKGLNKLLTRDLLTAYQDVIVRALNHSNGVISSQAMSILDMRENLNETTVRLLEDIKKECNGSSSKSAKQTESTEKPKQVKMVGSFLNRKASASKSLGSNKKPEKEERKTPQPLDSDSQEYVFIKSELKFDVSRLTEHQKESLKRRREDIPAMYNDLSQSSSQDTQNIQEWFNVKAKHIDKAPTPKKGDSSATENLDHEADKENKIDVRASDTAAEKPSPNVTSDAKTSDAVAQSTSTDQTSNDTKEPSAPNDRRADDENAEAKSADDAVEVKERTLRKKDQDSDENVPLESVAKRLNFESRDEFPDAEEHREQSPSVLDTAKKRGRGSSGARGGSTGQKTEEVVASSQDGQSASAAFSRTLRAKVSRGRGDACTTRQKSLEATEKACDENRRGTKRKSASDSESEAGANPRRRRKLMTSTEVPSDSDSAKSTESEHNLAHADGGAVDGWSQRTKNEISRLKINMVFGGSLPSRRRSKAQDDKEKEKEKESAASSSAKRSSPEGGGKGHKWRATDARCAENTRKGKYGEKEGKQGAVQPGPTRRTRRSFKSESEKGGEHGEGREDKSSVEGKDDGSEQDEGKSTDAAKVSAAPRATVLTSLATGDDKRDTENAAEGNERETEPDDDSAHAPVANSDAESAKSPSTGSDAKARHQSDTQDIVESSQSPTVTLKLDKLQSDKQCFIKISKIKDIPGTKEQHVSEKVDDPADSSVERDAADKNEANDVDDRNAEAKRDEVAADASASSVQENNDTLPEEPKSNSEGQKHDEAGSLMRSISASSFSSPKGTAKRYSKFKSYPTQGRAAHMLGLVTKQTLESESPAKPDDEPTGRKSKSKDCDGEASTVRKDRQPAAKDADKVAGMCGSRQEKIFSNMRSAEYCSSPPAKMFCNLKNDGERISSKVEKLQPDQASTVAESTAGNENEGGSPAPPEKDELPMLEWSSANPPSLTASPSASILKRQRAAAPEPEADSTTPNKRKRVSFADPPVSKEMGYEIATGSPHKVNKLSTPRGLLNRRDSPLRFKQTKLRMIQIDPEKAEKEEAPAEASSEVDQQCERENELLTKIAEELEYSENMSMDVDAQASCNYSEDEPVEDKKLATGDATPDRASREAAIDKSTSEDSRDGRHGEPRRARSTLSEMDAEEPADSETQEDIFEAVEPPANEPSEAKRDASGRRDALQFNVTNDSVIAALPEDRAENLEDTMDVQNLTGFNSTINPDEMFCEKMIRTSTQTPDNIAEQDTLPVTDSMFTSLPSSQDSQSLGENVDPESLDSTRPICPTLAACPEPVERLVDQLTNPLWVQSLSSHLSARNLRTVGDLARLSEREVNRLPVKGNPKIEFVKTVLRRFESSLEQPSDGADSADTDSTAVATGPAKTSQSVPMSSGVSVIQSTNSCKGPIASASVTEKPADASLRSSEEEPNATIDSSSDAPGSYQGPLTEMKSTSSISQSVMNFGTSTVNRTPSRPVSSVMESEAGKSPNEAGGSTKSVGVCTDPVHVSASPPTRKASKSVASQMALEDLLDEIDVNLVLQSAARRCSAENILAQYKLKMRHMSDVELERETVRLLGTDRKMSYSDVTLKAACRACGVNKVLLRLPDIFAADKQFFVKVLSAYRKKIKVSDCVNVLDFAELKEAICERCTSSELAEMLSKTLKAEERLGVKTPMTELSSLNAMLRRMPMDVIISHTVANDELVPSHVVLDIAMQNNSAADITQALQSQSPVLTKAVFDKLWSPDYAVSHIEHRVEAKEELVGIFKAVSAKFSAKELLDAFHESMKEKVDATDAEK